MKIFIGGDHAGYKLKESLIPYIKSLGFDVIDKGPYEYSPDDDYPDFCKEVAIAVTNDLENNFGIIIGGGGQGEAIVANRIKYIRAAVFYGPRQAVSAVDIGGRKSEDPYEVIKLAREHNNANVLSIGARFVSNDEAKQAVKIFIETPFSGDQRHIRRIMKIDE